MREVTLCVSHRIYQVLESDFEHSAPDEVLPEDGQKERRRSNVCKPTSVHNEFKQFPEDPNC